MTREECIEGLRYLRDRVVQEEQAKDALFRDWPYVDALLDHIEAHGFPAPEARSAESSDSAGGRE
jgi:hypothetical protein